MKSISKNIFGILAASLLISFTSCSDDSLIDNVENAGEEAQNVVTFHVAPYVALASSRAGDAEEKEDEEMTDEKWAELERETIKEAAPSAFGGGTQIDLLIFAVYKQNSEGIFELQPEFQKKTDDKIGFITAGEGQNLLKMTTKDWPAEIKLAIDPNATYRVVFWAQNSQTTAYETTDLTQIRANYDQAPYNNDELRDAFSAYKEITGYQTKAVEVTLHRPLAQINVGTTGWDYEGAAVLRPTTVSYALSQITLTGVRQYYNALDGRAFIKDPFSSDKETKVKFEYNRLPAFQTLTDEQWDGLTYKKYDNEQLLYVDLYTDEEHPDYNGNLYYTYKPWEAFMAYRNNHEDEFFKDRKRPLTEVFKYLSMCYVFVPEGGGVLSEVKFEAEDKNKKDGIGEVFTLTNIPVQKNWRTNIIGSSFFIDTHQFFVAIVPTFCGNYDNIDDMWQPGISFDEDGNWTGTVDPNQGFKDKWGEDYAGGSKADKD